MALCCYVLEYRNAKLALVEAKAWDEALSLSKRLRATKGTANI
jgi:hypothetical protein